MAKMEFSGNRGEWSEPYVVLRLMADGTLHQANANLLPDEKDFACILSVNRGDVKATMQDGGVVAFSYRGDGGQVLSTVVSSQKLNQQASRLFKTISAIKNARGSFNFPDEVDDLKSLGFQRLTSPLRDGGKTAKRDLELHLLSPNMGNALLGFSVKSQLGAPPTLFNASEATNIIYRVKGLTSDQAATINAMEGNRKIIGRCRAIKALATSIEYEAYQNSVFETNLDVIDSSLPRMLAELLKVHYFEQILLPRDAKTENGFRKFDRLDNAVSLLSKTGEYALKPRAEYCAIKIKRFLRACALGLMPSKVWNANDDASGGYIIVLPDGQLVALFVYNTTLLEKYLYETTIFERASTTRHKYLTLIPANDGTQDFLLKLNLQIRFAQ